MSCLAVAVAAGGALLCALSPGLAQEGVEAAGLVCVGAESYECFRRDVRRS